MEENETKTTKQYEVTNASDIIKNDENNTTDTNEKKTKKKTNKVKVPFKELTPLKKALAIGEWAFYTLCVLVIIFTLTGNLVTVSGYSMYPTFNNGDVIIASNIHDYNTLQRGDIVNLYFDEVNHKCIKRIVGLPGDHVEIREGYLYINNELADEYYITHDSIRQYGKINFDIYQQNEDKTKSILIHSIDIKGQEVPNVIYNTRKILKNDATQEYIDEYIEQCKDASTWNLYNKDYGILPKGEFFVLGDNRNGSGDSRIYGNVKGESILSKYKITTIVNIGFALDLIDFVNNLFK